jgi:hypothetical protein
VNENAKFLNFEVEKMEFSSPEDPDSQFATAKVLAFASGNNKHGRYCSEEVLRNTAATIKNKPLLYSLDTKLDDFYTHMPDPADSLIAGFCIGDSVNFTQLDDGRTGLYVETKIWKKYAPKVIDILKRDSNKKSVSVEMMVYDESLMPDGMIEMKDFAYSGVMILGSYVTPALPGAEIELMSFSVEENTKVTEAYELEFGKYDPTDFTIPKEVKKNAQMGLDLHKKYNRGANSVSLSLAKYLSSNDKITTTKVKHLVKHFGKHSKDNLDNKSSNEWISWQLLGGYDGLKWSEKLLTKMEKIDSENMNSLSYFGEESTFPYKSKTSEKEEMSMTEEEKKKLEEEKAKEAKEDPKEEKTETPEEEKKEAKEEKMAEDEKPVEEKPAEEKKEFSLDPYLDVAALLAFLENETEDYREIAEEFAKKDQMNYGRVMGAMYSKMCKMSAKMAEYEKDKTVYMQENEELKKFKAEKDQEQFAFAVDSTLKDISDKVEIPHDELEALKEDSKNYSLETIDAWRNMAKSKALDFAIKKVSGEEKPYSKYGLPIVGNDRKLSSSPWTR